MASNPIKSLVQSHFNQARIAIDGAMPWDIRVYEPKFYQRLINDRSVGLGEAYMDGWIDVEAIDEMIYRLCLSPVVKNSALSAKEVLCYLKALVTNPQTYLKSFVVGKKHYDLGNDLFQAMLDKNMVYSCAYWKEATNLDEAQEAKLDLICRKLYLQPGMKVLDIGCGWGGFAAYAANKYGAEVVGVTVSKEQCEWAQERCKGLPVEIRMEDYRMTKGGFDRIVSVGQFEHVGYKNYAMYMTHVGHLLKPNGLFLLHTIGSNVSARFGEPWMEKYIFPNSMTPSCAQIGKSVENRFVIEDWHNFGADYDKTLMAWYNNFENYWKNHAEKYGEKFYRMWRFYLLSCAGAFRARSVQLWQIVLSKEGVPGGYYSIR